MIDGLFKAGVPYQELVVAFSVGVYCLHSYLDIRQLQVRVRLMSRAGCMSEDREEG
jgi:hypothetical protein